MKNKFLMPLFLCLMFILNSACMSKPANTDVGDTPFEQYTPQPDFHLSAITFVTDSHPMFTQPYKPSYDYGVTVQNTTSVNKHYEYDIVDKGLYGYAYYEKEACCSNYTEYINTHLHSVQSAALLVSNKYETTILSVNETGVSKAKYDLLTDNLFEICSTRNLFNIREFNSKPLAVKLYNLKPIFVKDSTSFTNRFLEYVSTRINSIWYSSTENNA